MDEALRLADLAARTLTGNGTVSGSETVVDLNGGASSGSLGAGPLFNNGAVAVNVQAIDVASGSENYKLLFQGSDTPNFSGNVVNLAMLELGAAAGLLGGANVDSAIGTYLVPLTNELNGTVYRYIRVRHVIAGTTPSITYQATLGHYVN